MEIGSGLGLAFVLFGSGITGISTGAGSGYSGFGKAEIIGVDGAAAGVGFSLGIFTGAGEDAAGAGVGVGWVVVTGGGVADVGVGVGVTTAVGG